MASGKYPMLGKGWLGVKDCLQIEMKIIEQHLNIEMIRPVLLMMRQLIKVDMAQVGQRLIEFVG